MGEDLQVRPFSYSTSARIAGSGLEALTQWRIDPMNKPSFSAIPNNLLERPIDQARPQVQSLLDLPRSSPNHGTSAKATATIR